MCFTIHRDHPRVKVAKQDIKCFKVFRLNMATATLFSLYQWFEYEFGENYYEDSMYWVRDGRRRIINIGLHSYSDNIRAIREAAGSDNRIIIKCIIPEGSKYYYNPDDDTYVSDNLTVGQRIDILGRH